MKRIVTLGVVAVILVVILYDYVELGNGDRFIFDMALPQFDMAPSGGPVVPAPFNRRQDVHEQSIRDAEIPRDRYYPKGYQPDMLPF